MAITWGAWAYSGGNGMRVGLEITQSGVDTNSTSVTWTIKIYTENQYAYGDSQVLTQSGDIGGTYSFTNSSGAGAVLRATTSYTWNYTTYGSSPGTRYFASQISGAYNGVTPWAGVTVTIPARPYAAPIAPSSVAAARNSDTQATVTWARNVTAQKPYTSVTVQMRTYTGSTWGGWTTVATTSSTATSYVKTGLSADRAYQFQVKSNNSIGSSGYVASGTVYMTPAAPSAVVSALNVGGTSITTTWANNHYDGTGITLEIQRSVAGGAYANVVTGLARTVTSWTDTSPGAGTNTYKVRAIQATGSLGSAYATGNTVSTIVPPLAPTLLSPNGTRVDLTQDVVLTWQHNPGGDGAAQTQYSIEYSTNGGSSWTALPSATAVASAASTHTIAAGTLANSVTPYQWRVSTKGAAASFGPNSAAATFTGSSIPVVNLTAPVATTTALPLVATWTYTQAQSLAQAAWEATLYEDTGSELIEREARSGTGTALTTTFTYPVIDGVDYVVEARAQSSGSQWSALDSQATVIDLPQPAEPVIEGEYQLCTGTVVLSIAQLPPLLDEIAISTIAIERRVEGGDWVQLVSGQVLPANGEADRTNRVPNPRAAVSATGWTVNAGTGGTAAVTRVAGGGPGGVDFARATWSVASTAVNSGQLRADGRSVAGYDLIVVPGEVLSGSMQVRSSIAQRLALVIVWFDASGTQVGISPTSNAGPAQVVTANTWTEMKIENITVPANAAYALIGPQAITGTGSVVWPIGATLDATQAQLELGATVGTYFDGSSTSASWLGTPHESSSLLRAGPSDAVDFIDPIPLTKGLNEYRVTATSAAPSYRVSEIIEVEGTDGVRPFSCDGLWVFLAYGPGFSQVLRFKHNPSIKESAESVRSAQSFLGRRKPVLLAGANIERRVGVSGSLYFARALTPDPGCRDDSPPNDWLTAGQEALVVAYRDYTGRRIFGMLSGVDSSDDVPGIASISFDVTETDYVETYG